VRSGVCQNRKPLNNIHLIGMGLIARKSARFENGTENKFCDGIEELIIDKLAGSSGRAA
jgi:hypothetical protein